MKNGEESKAEAPEGKLDHKEQSAVKMSQLKIYSTDNQITELEKDNSNRPRIKMPKISIIV